MVEHVSFVKMLAKELGLQCSAAAMCVCLSLQVVPGPYHSGKGRGIPGPATSWWCIPHQREWEHSRRLLSICQVCLLPFLFWDQSMLCMVSVYKNSTVHVHTLVLISFLQMCVFICAWCNSVSSIFIEFVYLPSWKMISCLVYVLVTIESTN